MTRLKVLCGLFVLMALVAGATFLFTDWGSYWTDLAAPDKEQPALPANRPRTASRRAPASKPADERIRTLLRELPRQALLITAAHELGLPACDRSVDFAGADVPGQLDCGVSYRQHGHMARVTIRDAGDKELCALDLPVPVLNQDYPDYARLAAAIEPWCDSKFAPLLTAPAASRAKPVAFDAGLPVPPEAEALLAQVDPQRAFLAAHLLHETVAASGESPQRLAALARAYSHLGESTRYLYSPHGSAFFARALIYAERLARKCPDLPLSHAARGYVYTLLGQPLEGRRAFEKARQLAGPEGPIPSWAVLTEDLNHFRTRQLFEHIDEGADAPLASYLTLLSVEHTGMASLVINTARLGLQTNPGALRILNIMTDNSGVSLQHQTTSDATIAQFKLLSELAQQQGVPETIRSAAASTARRNFQPPDVLALLAAMDREPSTPGQLLPWSVYASISRDALFVSGLRRLYFTDCLLAIDPAERLASWWPFLKDHRYAPVIAGFDRSGKLGYPGAVEEVRSIDLLKLRQRMDWMHGWVEGINPPAGPAAQRRWRENYAYTSDDTAYDLAHLLWTYSGKGPDAVPVVGWIKGEIARSLTIMCPDHPSALADLIVDRWAETRARAAEIEREMGSHPQVGYALARAYRSENRFADAARLLEQVIEVAPDLPACEELAELYKEQGDVDKWLGVYDKYLANTEQFGLEHARKSEQIAYAIMRMKKPERALPYAKAAADSFSAWGLHAYAACLTELGHYEEAEQVQKANQQRYPGTFAWYRWCQTTGRGDLAAARALSEEQVTDPQAIPGTQYLNDIAVYHQLEGRPDRARACWERLFKAKRDPYEALQLAMLDLEQGKSEAALARLEQVQFEQMPDIPPEAQKLFGSMLPKDDPTRIKVYTAAVEEVQRCLADPDAVPRRDGLVKDLLDATGTAYRGAGAYLLGRLCELRGKSDDARWWYRTSLQTQDWNFSCRPQAAAGLRRLGEEFYP